MTNILTKNGTIKPRLPSTIDGGNPIPTEDITNSPWFVSRRERRGRLYPVVLLVVAGIAAGLSLIFVRPNSIQTLPVQAVTQPLCGTWQIMITPSSFRSVVALSDKDIWFAGMRGDSSAKSGPAFGRWNGSNLTMMPSADLDAEVIDVRALAVRTEEDAWAIGYSLQGAENKVVTFHWNGEAWSLVPAPDLPPNSVNPMTGVPDAYAQLTAVTIISENDVWAVGQYPQEGLLRTLVMHWDGNEWKLVISPNVSGTDNYLYSIVPLARDDIWALGYTGSSAYALPSLALRWDGASWKAVDNPDLGPVISGAVDKSKNIWVVNNVPTAENPLGSAVRRSGGERWDKVAMPQVVQAALRSVSALASNDVWAVGVKWSGYPSDAKPNQIATRSLVMHWDGSSWSEVPGPDPSYIQSLEAVTVSPNGDVWVVGASADDKDSPVQSMIGRFVRCSVPAQKNAP